MSMDQFLAEHYGNPSEDFEKEAQAELFAKLAADQGIDLNQLSDAQVGYLWNQTFSKLAEEEDDEDEDEDEDEKALIEEAAREHEEQKEAMAKVAEADYLGRVMAHSMTDELQKISGVVDTVKGYGSRAFNALKRSAKAEGAREGFREARRYQGYVREMQPLLKDKAKAEGVAHNLKYFKEQRNAAIKRGLKGAAGTTATYAVPLGAAGAGVYAATRKKQSSALDALASEYAVEKAAEAGWDAYEAAGRVDAVVTLGAGDSMKTASASSLDEAAELRSLELLELAGYPVTW